MNGFEQRAQRIKETIMDTTLRMMGAWEPKRLRIADIAKEAGVSQVTIYNYFGSKERLLRETFKRYIDRSIEEFRVHMDGGYSFKETIAFIMFNEQQSYMTKSLDLIQELMVDDKVMFAYIEEQYATIVIPLFGELIERGRASGEVSEKVTVPIVMAYIRMFMSQTGELLEMAKQGGDPGAFIEELTHLFFYGICGKA
ncbi:TetR/AcrR family transcriptional regulator [Paenibacillus aurantiacus]|uniref:TetR/AcrR family transcriptional regulator n=1 Tax=Paenibacillus aurantiacus TaxID=1936118 RepID=A0ABV5KVF6_9BACL